MRRRADQPRQQLVKEHMVGLVRDDRQQVREQGGEYAENWVYALRVIRHSGSHKNGWIRDGLDSNPKLSRLNTKIAD
jgi:hypothetical protein